MARLGASLKASDEEELEALEGRLKAISFSNRLKLLEMLRVPRTVDELHLTPSRPAAGDDEEGEGGDRPLSREAVRHHLERLADAELVRSELVQDADGRNRKRYVLDESRLFDLAETLRAYCRSDVPEREDLERTEPGERGAAPEPWPAVPRLVLVHGAPERTAYALRTDDIDPPRGWILGRGPDAQISLDYDPYVSSQNSEILPTEDGHEIVNFRSATNGTEVNDTVLEPGQTVPLEHGDVLQVGASTLVFQTR